MSYYNISGYHEYCLLTILCSALFHAKYLQLKGMVLAQVHHETRLRRRTQSFIGTAVEAYLRSDLLCGSPECSNCRAKTPGLPTESSHYLIPDSQALEDFLDVFELPDFTGFIILTSVLRKVVTTGTLSLSLLLG